MTSVISSWRELPFREIRCVDFEYYPGRGLSNGGREGDAVTPLCLVEFEMRSGRTVRLWQDEFGRFPPYRLDADALFISYLASAEFGCHIALGWGQPACALDPYVEFRHYVNDGTIKSGDREKGFFSLDGALHYFLEDGIDTAHKTEMRDRIVRGPPFTTEERETILAYCEEDTRSLARLVTHIVPTIRSLPHAMGRAKFMWTIAQQERRGIPTDRPLLTRLQTNWSAMQSELVVEMDAPFGIYEFKDGKPHWRKQRWADYVRRNRMSWPTYADGSLDERDKTFREMEGLYPQIGQLRELRYSLSSLRLNDLSVGNDGRNRCLLGPYGSKTARNQPSNAKYLFGPAKWIRFLITPEPGRVLIHRDYSQQEVHIAAVLSGDAALLEACQSGDVYLGIAKQLGLAPEDATPETHKPIRTMFKTVVLGIQYGLGARTLASRIGLSLFEAGEILARLRARFRTFEAYAQCVLDRAGLDREIGTQLGWYMQCPPGINPRTVRNFPIQSTGAEILHVACILGERRGIQIVAPVGLADAFQVRISTIRLWMNIYPEFSEAIKVEKAAANQRVERSLYQRANGYNYDAVKVFMPAGAKQPVIVHYTEHCPPDVGAAFIWLKNRDPDRWRDVQNVEHVMGKYLISDRPMTLEEWASARATVVNEVIDDSVTPAAPLGITQRKKGP